MVLAAAARATSVSPVVLCDVQGVRPPPLGLYKISFLVMIVKIQANIGSTEKVSMFVGATM